MWGDSIWRSKRWKPGTAPPTHSKSLGVCNPPKTHPAQEIQGPCSISSVSDFYRGTGETRGSPLYTCAGSFATWGRVTNDLLLSNSSSRRPLLLPAPLFPTPPPSRTGGHLQHLLTKLCEVTEHQGVGRPPQSTTGGVTLCPMTVGIHTGQVLRRDPEMKAASKGLWMWVGPSPSLHRCLTQKTRCYRNTAGAQLARESLAKPATGAGVSTGHDTFTGRSS